MAKHYILLLFFGIASSTTLPNGCPADHSVHRLLPHETDCAKFYHCELGKKSLRLCPTPLHFDVNIQTCNWPDAVNCVTKQPEDPLTIEEPTTTGIPDVPETTEEPIATGISDVPETTEQSTEFLPNGCPADFSIHFLLPHETDCTKFYYCEFGKKALRQCYPPLYFDASIQVCNWPHEVQCTTTQPDHLPTTKEPVEVPDTTAESTTTERPSEFLPNGCPADFSIHLLLPHETDCSKFYYCNFGNKVVRNCQPPLLFDVDVQVCNWPQYVDCNQGTTTEDTPTTTGESKTTDDSTTTEEPTKTEASTTTEIPTPNTTEESTTATTEELETTETETYTPSEITTEEPSTTENPSLCPSGFIGNVPHPYKCDSFFICTGWLPMQMFCTPDFEFDPETRRCVQIAEGGCTWRQNQSTTETITTETITTEPFTTESTTKTTENTEEITHSTEQVTEELITNEPTSEEPLTYPPTTEESTTYEQTTEELTTYEPTVEESTTYEPITEESTRYEPTTEQSTTYEPTTDESTKYEPTTEELTTYASTPEDLTTHEPTTENLTTYEPTTEEVSTKELTTNEPTTDELITFEPTTEESTTYEPTTDEGTTIETTTEELTTYEPTEETTTYEPLTEKPITYEPTTEELTTYEPTTEKITTYEPTTEELHTYEPTTEKTITNEPTTEELTTYETTTEKIITYEHTTEKFTSYEPTTEKSTTYKSITEKLTTYEPTTYEPTTEEITTFEPTTEEVELTTEDSISESTTNIPTTPPICSDGVFGHVPHPDLCDSYFLCTGWLPMQMFCPPGEEFDPETGLCVIIVVGGCTWQQNPWTTNGPTKEDSSEITDSFVSSTVEDTTTSNNSTQSPEEVTSDEYTELPTMITENLTSEDSSVETITFEPTPEDSTMYESTIKEVSTIELITEESTTNEPSTEKTTTYKPTTTTAEELTTYEQTTEESTTYETITEESTTYKPTTKESTTNEPITEESTTYGPTLEESTSYEPITEESTTYEPTTEESTTYEPTTDDSTTYEPTTEESTAYEPTMEESTTYEPTTDESTAYEPITDESTIYEQTTEESTTYEPTVEESTTYEPTIDESTAYEPITEESTTYEPTTEESTTYEPTTVDSTTYEPTTEESTTYEPTVEKSTTYEPTTAESTTYEPTMEESTTHEPATEESTKYEPTTEESTTNEPTTEESTTSTDESTKYEPTTKESSTYEPTTKESTTLSTKEESTTYEPTKAESTTYEPNTEESTTYEPTKEESTTYEPNTEESTTYEPTTEDSTTYEPVTGETTTYEPTIEESITDEPTTEESTTLEPITEESTTYEATIEESTTYEPTPDSTAIELITKDPSTTETTVTEAPVCPDGVFGHVPHPVLCDSYFLCTGWFPVQLFCPPGEEFDPVTSLCVVIAEDGCTWQQNPWTTNGPTTDESSETTGSDELISSTVEETTIDNNSTITPAEPTEISTEVTENISETKTSESTTEESTTYESEDDKTSDTMIEEDKPTTEEWTTSDEELIEETPELVTATEESATDESTTVERTTKVSKTYEPTTEKLTTQELSIEETSDDVTYKPSTEPAIDESTTEGATNAPSTIEPTTEAPVCPIGMIGHVPHPEFCDSYFLCTGWLPMQMFCPPGEEFDPIEKLCVLIAKGGCTWQQNQSTTNEPTVVEEFTTLTPEDTVEVTTESNSTEADTNTQTTTVTSDVITTSDDYDVNITKSTESDRTTTEKEPITTEVEEVTTEEEQTTTESSICPPGYYGSIPHPELCNSYYLCTGWQPMQLFCPANTEFDPEKQDCVPIAEGGCNWQREQQNTTEYESEPTSNYETSENNYETANFLPQEISTVEPIYDLGPNDNDLDLSATICPSGVFGNIPHPDRCDAYVMCTGWNPIQIFCPTGQEFDPELRVCTRTAEGGCTWLQNQRTTSGPNESENPETTEEQTSKTVDDRTENEATEQTTTTTNSEVELTCPDGFLGTIAHPERCDVYIICSGWSPILVTCIRYQEFDPVSQTCVQIADGGCTWRQNQLTTTRPETTDFTDEITTENNTKDITTESEEDDKYVGTTKKEVSEEFHTTEYVPETTETTVGPICPPGVIGNIPHPDRCDSYFICSGWMPIQIFCPAGTEFDEVKNNCVPLAEEGCTWRQNHQTTTVPPTDNETTEPETTEDTTTDNEISTSEPEEFSCPDGFLGALPHAERCDVYFICSGWSPILVNCRRDQEFDPVSQACVQIADGGCTWRQNQLSTQSPTDSVFENSTTSKTVEETTREITTEIVTTDFVENTAYITEAIKDSTNHPETTTSEYLPTTEYVPETTEPICPPGLIGNVPHTDRCDTYFICSGWMPIQIFCPSGTEFDDNKSNCVPIAEGGCTWRQNNPTTEPPTTEPETTEFSCPSGFVGTLPHPERCDVYFICSGWNPIQLSCRPYEEFDPASQTCVAISEGGCTWEQQQNKEQRQIQTNSDNLESKLSNFEFKNKHHKTQKRIIEDQEQDQSNFDYKIGSIKVQNNVESSKLDTSEPGSGKEICAPGLAPHPSRCDVFYLCSEGRQIEMKCIGGMEYDATSEKCQPSNAPCQRKSKPS